MSHLTLEALVFIAAALIFVPLFQKLGFGSVLGYLLSGLLIGPWGLQLIKDSESVMHFSELGVSLLLFIIGLEIQPRKLWAMKKHLIGYGGLQIILSSLFFSIVISLFGFSLVPSVVIGFSLSLSSTAFAVQMLKENNLFNTEFGRASFSVLLMQDLLAIPALALIPILAAGYVTNQEQPSVKFLAFALIASLVFISRYLMRPIFRLIASTRSREVFTAMTLFIVLGVSALMQKVGLSAALGAFISGVLLADSEYRHELEANIEPFKGLLMGLFFIAVGMGVNLDLILENPVFILGLSLGYIIFKMLIIYAVGRMLKMNHDNSKMMGLSIAQGGEFAFVIYGLIAKMNFVEEKSLSYLTAIITLSMALNPIFNLLNQWITKSRRKEIPQFDEIKDESPDVIIAGFGRFGQIFGRILRAQDIPFVAIDHDSNQIELIRRFGNKVYYGDVSRHDILEAAGAAQAKYFILAIDDIELSLKTIDVINEHFPHLKIYARARNRGHAFDMMDKGVQKIKRETFDSSVNFTKDLLVDMGYELKLAERMIERFKVHDEIMIKEQFKVRQDDKSLISVSLQGVAQLAQVLNDDTRQTHVNLENPQKK